MLEARLDGGCSCDIACQTISPSIHPSSLSCFQGKDQSSMEAPQRHQGLFSLVYWEITSTFSFKISFPLLVIAFKLICFTWSNGVVVKLLINLVIVTTPRFDSWWDATFAADGLPR